MANDRLSTDALNEELNTARCAFERAHTAYTVAATMEWHTAVSDYEAAEAALTAHGGDHQPGSEGERECDRLADIAFQARERMFMMPAPHPTALAYKMRELESYMRELLAEDANHFGSVAADVRRLFGVEA